MGRKRKLSEEHLQRLMERHIAGESIRKLADEVGMAESSLRALISAQSAQIKTAANHIIAAERTLTSMPISAQITARTLASKLMRAMDNMASGSELMGGSFLRLAMAHNAQAQKLDEVNPLTGKGSGEAMIAMAALGKLANQAAEVPLRLVTAMREGLAGEEEGDDGDMTPTIRIIGGLPD